MDLKLTVDGLEKERDFYFSKLRDIELICQEHENENSPIITGIVSVLYATEVSTEHALPVRLLVHPAPERSGLPLGQDPLPQHPAAAAPRGAPGVGFAEVFAPRWEAPWGGRGPRARPQAGQGLTRV